VISYNRKTTETLSVKQEQTEIIIVIFIHHKVERTRTQ